MVWVSVYNVLAWTMMNTVSQVVDLVLSWFWCSRCVPEALGTRKDSGNTLTFVRNMPVCHL